MDNGKPSPQCHIGLLIAVAVDVSNCEPGSRCCRLNRTGSRACFHQQSEDGLCVFFLAIDADHRMSSLHKPLLDSANVAELLVSLRVLSGRNSFSIGFERIALLAQQPSNADMTQ